MHKTSVTKQTSHDFKIFSINLFIIVHTKKNPNKLHFYYDIYIFFFEYVIFEGLFE
jgi:hypothetical protein